MIEDCVRTLAKKHNNVRFVRLHYQDAEMEPAGVPALIAYRGGDKFAGLVPIMEEMPDDAELSSLTLEAVMMRYVDRSCFRVAALTNTYDADIRSCHRFGLHEEVTLSLGHQQTEPASYRPICVCMSSHSGLRCCSEVSSSSAGPDIESAS